MLIRILKVSTGRGMSEYQYKGLESGGIECKLCGSVVSNTEVHNRWHENTEVSPAPLLVIPDDSMLGVLEHGPKWVDRWMDRIYKSEKEIE